MLTPFIIYVQVILAAGLASLYPWKQNSWQKHAAAIVICAGSLLCLGYLSWIFRWIKTDAVSGWLNWQLPFASLRWICPSGQRRGTAICQKIFSGDSPSAFFPQ